MILVISVIGVDFGCDFSDVCHLGLMSVVILVDFDDLGLSLVVIFRIWD